MYLNDFPIELLSNIFKKLPTIQIFTTARLVCKRWKFIIDYSLKLDRLVLFVNVVPYCEKYFYDNSIVDLNHAFKVKDLDILKFKVIRSTFSGLKRLFIYGELAKNEIFDLRNLSSFIRLEQLEIYNIPFKETDNFITLPYLKVFSFKRCNLSISKLNILNFVCPQLVALNANNSINIDFSLYHPERVRYLEGQNFRSIYYKFTNLEVIKLKLISFHLKFDHKFLLKFKKLKEILFFQGAAVYEELKRQKRIYHINQVKIYYLGIDFDNFDKLPAITHQSDQDLFYLNDNNLELYFNNYKNLANFIPFIQKINYNSFVKFCNKLPSDFFQIFSSLNSVVVQDKIEDQIFFIEFLKNCKCLNNLHLEQSNLPQEFYDELHLICSINYLKIIESTTIKSFKFARNLTNLVFLHTNRHMSFDDAHLILKNCKFLKSFYFLNFEKEISIVKKNDKLYESNAFGIILAHNSLDGLILFLKRHNEVI